MRTNYYKCTVAALLLIALWSCGDSDEQDPLAFIPPVFPEEIEITPTYLDVDIISGVVMEIEVKDTTLLLRSYDGKRNIQVLDKRSGKFISGMIPAGRGFGELISVISISVREDSVYAYSIMDSRLYKYSSDSVYYALQPDNVVNFNDRTLILVYPVKNKYIGLLSRNKRIKIYDEFGIEESAYDKYPDFSNIGYSDSVVVRNILFSTQSISVKPDNTKFVSAHSWGAMFEIFSLSGDAVSLYREKRFYPPKVSVLKPFKDVEGLPDQVSGFWGVTSTDNYIYLSFCGEKFSEERRTAHYVYVFDWEGNPVRSYKIKGGIRKLDIDSENRKIYFSTRNADGEERLGYFDVRE